MAEKRELIDTINMAITNAMANMHTAAIAKVTKVNSKLINCKPVVNRNVNGKDIELPEFIDVPLITLQGGGLYITFPVKEGDYVFLIFNERCYDNWYSGDDFVQPLEYRMHDYSDGFAISGVNPQASLKEIPTANITISGNVDHTGDYTQTGNYTITGNIIVNGNLTVNGNTICTGTIAAANYTGLSGAPVTSTVDFTTTGTITGQTDVSSGGISLKTHTHGGVTTGSGSTGGPQ